MKPSRVSYSTISNYFKDLINKTPYIKSYIGSSRTELQNKLTSRIKIEDPFFVLWGYGGKLEGNNKQRTQGCRSINFSILFRIKPDDYTAQEDAYDKAELYGLNIIARIYQESCIKKYGWLSNFDKDAVSWEPVEYQTANGLFGVEFSLLIPTKDPLTIDYSFWADIKDCSEI